MVERVICVLAVALLLGSLTVAQNGGKDDETADKPPSQWVCVTEEAAFSPRDTAEDCVFDGKMWISNGYYHGNVLTRDLWWSTDGATWTRVSEATPYPGYSEMVAYDGKMWAIKGSVWNSIDGLNWTQVLEKTPFGTRGYGEVLVFQDKIWHLTSGDDIWNTTDGVTWTRVADDLPYGPRGACAVAAYKDKLWVIGGRISKPNDPPEKGGKNATTYNDVWCSADGVNWEQVLEHAPWGPRMWFIAAVYAGKLWIIGGYDNLNRKNFGDVWYTEDGVTWHEFESEETGFSTRHESTVYVYDGSLWVVAGNHWPVQNDVWRLTLPDGWDG